MGFLDLVRACHHWEPGRFRPFVVGGARHGFVKHEIAALLEARPDVFRVTAAAVHLSDVLQTVEARTEGVASVLRPLQDEGRLPPWRGEAYAVLDRWDSSPSFLVDRGAAATLGVPTHGIHLNGYVRRDDGLHLWMGRRSDAVAVDPGTLDHVVAGGLPAGLTLEQNLRKECDEEASIPSWLADRARSTSVVTYRLETSTGLKDDTIFVYDLEMPADFVPVNRDGEVASFECWPVERVRDALREGGGAGFKFNVGPVLVDFLIRRGVITPAESDFVEILRALRS